MKIPRILVVEDYEPFRRFVCSSLRQSGGFDVFQASDGLEAVQKAEELQPDLILLDIGLPKLNGIEVAKRVCEFAPEAKILFLSQQSDSDVIRETFRLGAHGYVYKLRAKSELLPAIEAVLGGKRFVSSRLGFGDEADAYRRHEVEFYSDDSVFLESTARFIGNALKAHNAAIVVATKSHRDGLVERLNGEGFNVDGEIEQGTYFSLDAGEMLSTIMANGVPNGVLFSEGLHDLIELAAKSVKTAHPRVAVFGECVGLLYAEGNLNAALSLERTGNDLLKTHNIDILCAYPFLHWQLDEDSFRRISAEHTAVYTGRL
jgi:CheY-like chemotaxis protein